MPRLAVFDARIDENHNLDFCMDCWDSHVKSHDEVDAKTIAEATGIKVELIERSLSVEDTESGCEHPSYADDDYDCRNCKTRLTAKDN